MTVKISTEMKKNFQWHKMDFNHPTSNPRESSGISWDLITLFFCYIKNITFLSSFIMHCMTEFW